MPNGDNKAFNAMNVVTATDEVDLTDDGEVSAWFPTGKFLGMKIPKGTAGIVEGLAFLAIGSPGPKVVKAVTNQIKKQAASLSPEMHGAVIMKASDYMKRAEQLNRKIAVAGESGLGRKLAIESKAVADYAKRLHGEQYSILRAEPAEKFRQAMSTNIPSAARNVAQRAQPIGRRSLADVPIKSDVTRVLDKSKKYQDYLRDFKYKEFEIARKSSVGFAPAFEAIAKFSIPSLLDELEK